MFRYVYLKPYLLFQADVLEYYDQTVSSPSGSFYIPAVLRVCIKHVSGSFMEFFSQGFTYSNLYFHNQEKLNTELIFFYLSLVFFYGLWSK